MHDAAAVEPIPLRNLVPWTAAALLLLAGVYLVGFEHGAVVSGAGSLLHELMHDGRHVLGVPCH